MSGWWSALQVLALAAAVGAAPAAASGGEDEGRPPVPAGVRAEALPKTVTLAVDRPLVSPTRAVLMSPLFPGWGQLYAQSSWRAALAFGAETLYWSQLIKNDRKAVRWRTIGQSVPAERRDVYDLRVDEYRERVRDFAWWSLGALLIITLDAYVDANLYGFDQDPVPVPDRWDDAAGAAAGPTALDADFALVLWRADF